MKFFENCFFFDKKTWNEQTTNIRCPNVVNNHKDAFWIIFKSYDFTYENFNDQFVFYRGLGRNILIDNSAELTSEDLVDFLNSQKHLYGVTLVTNGFRKQRKENEILTKNGCKVIKEPFFLKYGMEYYQPVFTSITPRFKKFLLLNGKPRPLRTLLTSLIYHHNLDRYGYISYFHSDQTGRFYPERSEDVNQLTLSAELKEQVKNGLSIMGGNIILDEPYFNYSVSHSRRYNGDYYNAVDFVVVIESDVSHKVNFITEKTLKPIQLNKKFILISEKGMLETTKNTYKQLFKQDISHLTDWCDTSYDSIHDPIERTLKVFDIIHQNVTKS